MLGPDRRLPLAFVADVDAPELTDGDRHHLGRVLRLRPGDELTAGDGGGRFRTVRFGPRLEPTSAVVSVPRPDPPLTVAIALAKGDRPEIAVQKLTEVGIDRIVPFVAGRSVVRWDAAKAERNAGRWAAIARAAAAQAHRAWLPEVAPVAGFDEVAALPGAALADPDGEAPSGSLHTLIVGPEGGWTAEELTAVHAHVALPGHVLRAETAAIVAGAMLVAGRAGWLR